MGGDDRARSQRSERKSSSSTYRYWQWPDSEMNNNRRYDLSERLIHFFRNLDLDDGSAPHVPEHWGWANITESTRYSALFLMRSAIRHGRLWATWAMRNRVRTIYGPHPAICLTDMPTAAFLEASVERQKAGQKISTFALTFPKDQMFDLGARPVIYGLTDDSVVIPNGRDGGPRVIPPEALPLSEQYRYVSYYPSGRWRVDWTHEREWRWSCTGGLREFEAEIEGSGIVDEVRDIPGLDLYSVMLSGIGVIVNTKEDADMVLHDVLALVDRQEIAPNTYEYVLVSDEITSPSAIRDPGAEEEAIAAATIDLSDYLRPQPERDERLEQRVKAIAREVEEAAGDPVFGEQGGCWLWLVDSLHPVTRALMNTDSLVINNEGKYLMFPYAFSDARGLREREEMTLDVARRLREEFDIEAGYYSVLASGDPNGLPYYNDDHLDNKLHYNWWFHGLS